jgi:hypothetical protein
MSNQLSSGNKINQSPPSGQLAAIENQAQALLGADFAANPQGDPIAMVNGIIAQLSPSDPSMILQLAASDPQDLSDTATLSTISQYINLGIQQALLNEVNNLQLQVDNQISVAQAELDSLTQQQANLAALLQAIQNAVQPVQTLQQANQQVLNLLS